MNVNFFRPFQGLLTFKCCLIPTAHAVGYYLPPLAGLTNIFACVELTSNGSYPCSNRSYLYSVRS